MLKQVQHDDDDGGSSICNSPALKGEGPYGSRSLQLGIILSRPLESAFTKFLGPHLHKFLMVQRNFPLLDGLRGVGAILVLTYHIYVGEPLLHFAQRGYLAVDFFFLLSGFVIGLKYDEYLVSGALGVSRYMLRRLARLYPMLLLGLLLGIWRWMGHMPAGELAGRAFFQAMLLPFICMSGQLFLLNVPQWSLFFEITANAAHAVTAKVLTKRSLTAIVGLSAIALAAAIVGHGSGDIGAVRETIWGGYLRVSFSFFGGLLLYQIYSRGKLPNWKISPAITLFAMPFMLMVLSILPVSVGLSDAIVVLVIFPIILALAVMADVPESWKPMCSRAARLSYPVYALHTPIVLTAQDVLQAFAIDNIFLVLIYWVAVISFIFAFSAVAECFFDRPLRLAIEARAFRLRERRVTKAA